MGRYLDIIYEGEEQPSSKRLKMCGVLKKATSNTPWFKQHGSGYSFGMDKEAISSLKNHKFDIGDDGSVTHKHPKGTSTYKTPKELKDALSSHGFKVVKEGVMGPGQMGIGTPSLIMIIKKTVGDQDKPTCPTCDNQDCTCTSSDDGNMDQDDALDTMDSKKDEVIDEVGGMVSPGALARQRLAGRRGLGASHRGFGA